MHFPLRFRVTQIDVGPVNFLPGFEVEKKELLALFGVDGREHGVEAAL